MTAPAIHSNHATAKLPSPRSRDAGEGDRSPSSPAFHSLRRIAPRPRPRLVIERARQRVVNHDCLGSTGNFYRFISVPRVRWIERGFAS